MVPRLVIRRPRGDASRGAPPGLRVSRRRGFEMREDIPAVDLSLGEDAVASTIRRACTTHGFFYVVNHGVSDEEVGAMVMG